MTLQDLTEYLRERAQVAEPLSETVITRCLLLAYEMGLEQGKKERQSRARLTARPWPPAARATEEP